MRISGKPGDKVSGDEGSTCLQICVPYKHSPKCDSPENDFNSHLDKPSRPIDNSQLLSSATLFISQWAHEQSVHVGRNAGYSWSVTWTTTIQGCFVYNHCCRPYTQAALTKKISPIWHHSCIWWHFDYIGLLPSWKVCPLSLLG